METLNSLRVIKDDSDDAVCAATGFLRNDILQLVERAEALELPSVIFHLQQAARLCSPEVPDHQTA